MNVYKIVEKCCVNYDCDVEEVKDYVSDLIECGDVEEEVKEENVNDVECLIVDVIVEVFEC